MSMDTRARELELNRFVRWGDPIATDLARRILSDLPICRPEQLVEIPNGDTPEEESLAFRVNSY